jgi:hypothetical protein
MGACGESTDVQGTASLRVLLTDAPIDYVDSAFVDIGAVELVPAGDGPIVVLSDDGTDGEVNLLDLQNSATLLLAEGEFEAGSYAQLRLIVESARVVLIDGYEFNGGGNEMALTVPSGAQTGIKLNLGVADGGQGGALLLAGETVVVVDFDVSRSFVIQGNPETPAGIMGMLFKPTLRLVIEDLAGSISGTVSTAVAGARVDSLTVTADPVDDGDLEPFQTQTATTMSAMDGTYTLPFLVPGTYWVKVTPADAALLPSPDSTSVTVGVSEDVTGIDFSIVE